MISFAEWISSIPLINKLNPEIAVALVAFIASIIILYLFRTYVIALISRLSKKTQTHFDDFMVDAFRSIHSPFYVYISFYIASRFVSIPKKIDDILGVITLIIVIYYATKFLQRIISHYTEKEIERRKKLNKEENSSMIRIMGRFIIIIIWILSLLLILANMGVEITPLIAGLGIGGVAIAFALQNILEDIFSAFSIYFDKPFKEGDFIIIGADMGVVQHIGIKTTRIKTLQGQELIVSNRELTSTRVNNYKKMDKRRIVFTFGLVYSTPSKKLKRAKEIIKEISKEIKKITLDRVHFKQFGPYSLEYEVVYYIDTSDYNVYMDTQEEFNLKIKEAFEKEKIEMAFPTQTLYLEK